MQTKVWRKTKFNSNRPFTKKPSTLMFELNAIPLISVSPCFHGQDSQCQCHPRFSAMHTPNSFSRCLFKLDSLVRKTRKIRPYPAISDKAAYVESTYKVATRPSQMGSPQQNSCPKPKKQPKTQLATRESLNFPQNKSLNLFIFQKKAQENPFKLRLHAKEKGVSGKLICEASVKCMVKLCFRRM